MGRKRESKRKRSRVLVGRVLAVLAVASGCDDGAVRFGPTNNLRPKKSDLDCPLPAGVGRNCPDWTKDVFPIFDSEIGDKGSGACTVAACHGDPTKGGNNSAGLALFKGDAAASYDSLAAYEQNGRPYVGDPDGDAKPYLLCNLTGEPLIGARMPKGAPIDDERLKVIGAWACCGMKQDTPALEATCEGGGASGAGGAGGAGGS